MSSQSKTTSTTYHIIGGGQRVQQNQNLGNNKVVIEKRETTYVADARADGGDSYTNEIWGSLDFVKSCARGWAQKPKALKFEVVEA